MSLEICTEKLACEGGSPVRTDPFPLWPYFAEDEIEAAATVLRSGRVNYWTGDQGKQFEREYAEFTGTQYAVALANGTVALEAALHGLGIGAGDDVIVPARTFIASASCAVMRGARPVIADVDRHSQNVTAETVEAALTPATRAIVAVHLAGWPCDMDPICDLARSNGVFVIEDCAQAHGATYKSRPVGGLGDVATFSFCQDKILTTAGEGGMLVTKKREVWRKAWELKDHGKSFAKIQHLPRNNNFAWVHDSFGTNWRMTEVQAAIGRVALRKLPRWVEQRRNLAAALHRRLSRIPGLRLTLPSTAFGHSYYKYYAFVRLEKLGKGWDRDRIVQSVVAENIPCYSGICGEIYREGAFSVDWRPKAPLPIARELADSSLMFLVHPTLSLRDIEQTATAVEKVMAKAIT